MDLLRSQLRPACGICVVGEPSRCPRRPSPASLEPLRAPGFQQRAAGEPGLLRLLRQRAAHRCAIHKFLFHAAVDRSAAVAALPGLPVLPSQFTEAHLDMSMDPASPCAFAGTTSRPVPAPLAVRLVLVPPASEARLNAALSSRSKATPQCSQRNVRSTRPAWFSLPYRPSTSWNLGTTGRRRPSGWRGGRLHSQSSRTSARLGATPRRRHPGATAGQPGHHLRGRLLGAQHPYAGQAHVAPVDDAEGAGSDPGALAGDPSSWTGGDRPAGPAAGPTVD